MLFCRIQEYYESPNPKFRGKTFDIWTYMKWYSLEYKRGFSYSTDWGGFNIPMPVAIKCFSNLPAPQNEYDNIMAGILEKIDETLYAQGIEHENAYIIGSGRYTQDDKTFKHELCHALYYTNPEYKATALSITKSLPPEHRQRFKENLLGYGYTESVTDDEIQAYLQYGWEYSKFRAGFTKAQCVKYHNMYKKALQHYIG